MHSLRQHARPLRSAPPTSHTKCLTRSRISSKPRQSSPCEAAAIGRTSDSNPVETVEGTVRGPTRREWLGLASAGVLLAMSSPSGVRAEETTLEVAATAAATPVKPPVLMKEYEYEFYAPGNFDYIEVQQDMPERGPAPERSPVLVRFEAAEGEAVISVINRGAQTLKQTFRQVGDITMLGTQIEVAALLLPKGAKLQGQSVLEITFPPQEVPILGTIEIPPKTYYRYDFIAPTGRRVYMSAAAMKGKVFVCGASMPTELWTTYKDDVTKSVDTFRLKGGPATQIREAAARS
eukprot:gene10368-8307_t